MGLVKFERQSSIEFEASDKINSLLMVCSHERSGTHFLLNSLDLCTYYKNKPLYIFDHSPYLGSHHDFLEKESNTKLFNNLSSLEINNMELCMASMVKSHFPIPLVSDVSTKKLKIAYIYRNPVDVFISYWKYLHELDIFEGPKSNTPLELATQVPCGNSQRYQIQNFGSYFERWAFHVSTANQYIKKSDNLGMISYQDLLNDHTNSINLLCKELNIEIIRSPKRIRKEDPKLSFYLKGANLELPQDEYQKLYDYCSHNVKKYSSLPYNIMNA